MITVPKTPKLPPPPKPDNLNLKPIKWYKEGIICTDEQGYKNFEWLLLEFERWKNQASARMDYYESD